MWRPRHAAAQPAPDAGVPWRHRDRALRRGHRRGSARSSGAMHARHRPQRLFQAGPRTWRRLGWLRDAGAGPCHGARGTTGRAGRRPARGAGSRRRSLRSQNLRAACHVAARCARHASHWLSSASTGRCTNSCWWPRIGTARGRCTASRQGPLVQVLPIPLKLTTIEVMALQYCVNYGNADSMFFDTPEGRQKRAPTPAVARGEPCSHEVMAPGGAPTPSANAQAGEGGRPRFHDALSIAPSIGSLSSSSSCSGKARSVPYDYYDYWCAAFSKHYIVGGDPACAGALCC